MNKKNIEFKIDQLRKDKMIFALESIALTFVVELGYVLFTILTGRPNFLIALLGLVIVVGFFLFAIIGNIIRCCEIRKLEKKLYKK